MKMRTTAKRTAINRKHASWGVFNDSSNPMLWRLRSLLVCMLTCDVCSGTSSWMPNAKSIKKATGCRCQKWIFSKLSTRVQFGCFRCLRATVNTCQLQSPNWRKITTDYAFLGNTHLQYAFDGSKFRTCTFSILEMDMFANLLTGFRKRLLPRLSK